MRTLSSSTGAVLFVTLAALAQTASTAPAVVTTGTCSVTPCTWIAFGPYTATRGTGAPVTVSESFSVANPNAVYMLRATNNQVSSANVWLNGASILTPSDFNRNVSRIDRAIQLRQQNTIAVELRSQPGASLVLEIIGVDTDPPEIAHNETPGANPLGWHNSENVEVSFTCSDSTSGIAFCSTPMVVSSEGANQLQGSARDVAGNTATISVDVNIDRTPPSITINSPADGSAAAGLSATVMGTVADALSGVASNGVTCNGVEAALSGSLFNCAVTLVPGRNRITVEASDRARNTATAHVDVTTEMPSATQHIRVLDIQPAAVPANAPTAVRVTAQVDVDATLRPDTITLSRYNAQTQLALPLTRMYDDGTHGDTLRGDNVFTATIVVDEPSPSIVFFVASSSYRNLSQPVFSEPVRLFVQATSSAEQALSDLADRLDENDINAARVFFAPSAKTTDFLSHLSAEQRTRLAAVLRALRLVSSSAEVRVYRGPWREPDGTTTDIEFGLSRDALGRWVIFSW